MTEIREIKDLNEADQYRILIPSEYEALLKAIPKDRLRIVIEGLLNTGMRYSEFVRFSKHLVWFDAKNRAISLPGEATKVKKSRVVHLTPVFSDRLYLYLRENKSLEVPDIHTMAQNLLRWVPVSSEYMMSWISPTPKTFRKTWESWLLKAGYPSMEVALSQGHSELIAYKHYATLDPRLKSEEEAVKRLTAGWGT